MLTITVAVQHPFDQSRPVHILKSGDTSTACTPANSVQPLLHVRRPNSGSPRGDGDRSKPAPIARVRVDGAAMHEFGLPSIGQCGHGNDRAGGCGRSEDSARRP